jgi:hypothetical protein
MSEPAKVFEDREIAGRWRVEWFNDDDRSEAEIFTGSDARRQALRYAVRQYAHFGSEARAVPAGLPVPIPVTVDFVLFVTD